MPKKEEVYVLLQRTLRICCNFKTFDLEISQKKNPFPELIIPITYNNLYPK